MTIPQRISVLLVEDNEFDVRRIERAINKLGLDVPLYRAADGQEGLDLLRQNNIQVPLIILLDINMPRMNGIEFLTELRRDPDLKRLPVHVVTTSDYFRDIDAVYEQGVCGYYVKPTNGGEMTEIARSLLHLASISEYPQSFRNRPDCQRPAV